MSERLRRLTLPVFGGIVLFAVALAAGFVTEGEGPNRDTALEDSQIAGVRGSVQSVSGNTITLVTESGPRQFTLKNDAAVEVLRPTTASTIAVGEWLNAGTIPNTQSMFTIVGLTLIPQPLLQAR
ncbi:MAG: hypothetical protein AB7P33_05935 [Dehalococcoidia bacterium]